MRAATDGSGEPVRETYFRVSPRIWTHGFSEDARTLALYLLTGPHRTTEGLYRLPLFYAAADLGWRPKRLQKPLQELLADGFIDYDSEHEIVFIRHALRYQAPANPNMMRAAAVRLAMLPETRLFPAFFEAACRYAKPFAQRLPQLLPERFGQPPTPPPPPTPTPRENPFVRSPADANRPNDVDSPQLPVENDNGSKPAKRKDADETFALFYSAYPRHEARAPAEKAWRRLTKAERQEAIAAAKRMAEHIRSHAIDLHLVALPATWLHQRRWEDWRDGRVPAHYQVRKDGGMSASEIYAMALETEAQERAHEGQ